MSTTARPARRALVGIAAATATAATAIAAPAGAAPTRAPAGRHCILDVIGTSADGELLTAPPRCFGTLAEALADVGAPVDPGESINIVDVTSRDLLAAATSSVIGVHYDGFNRTSSSITVSGADCAGGYLNLSTDWTNRISSTLNGCPVVRFFDGFDKTGTSEVTVPATVNLGSLNNAANSIQYASS